MDQIMEILKPLTSEQTVLFFLAALLLFGLIYIASKNYKVIFSIASFSFLSLVIISAMNPDDLSNISLSTNADGKLEMNITKEMEATLNDDSDDDIELDTSNLNDLFLYREVMKKSFKNRTAIDFLLISTKEWKDKNYEEALRQAYYGLKSSKDNKIKSLLEMRIGTIFKSLKKNSIAKKQYRIAIDIDKNNIFAYNNLGVLYRQEKDYILAENIYKRGIDVNNSYANTYFNLGFLYEEKKNMEKAEENYLKAIELDKDYINAYNRWGNIYKDTNKIDYAKSIFEAAQSLNPTYTRIYNNLGNIYKEVNASKSEQMYKKAIELNNNYATPYKNLGNLYRDTNRTKEAEEMYIKAIKFKKNYTTAYNNLGELYFVYMSDIKKAETKFKKALETDKKYLKAYYNLALLNYENKDEDSAKEYLKKALKLEPLEEKLYKHIKKLYKFEAKKEIEKKIKRIKKLIKSLNKVS